MDSSLVTTLIANAGVAGVVIVLILIGVLVPRPYHQRVMAENDTLRQANDTLTAANAQLRESNNALTSGGQLTNQILTALLDIAAGQHPPPPASAPAPAPVPDHPLPPPVPEAL